MRFRKLPLIALILVLTFVSFYVIFILDLPQLIRINQALGIEPSWFAFQEYLTHRVIGMPKNDVYSLFNRIGINVKTYPRGGCEYIQLGNLLRITSYIFCYDRDDKLTSVNLSS